jgi:hypothetical protein
MATDGGACKTNDISSGRSQVVTQVHIKRAASATQPLLIWLVVPMRIMRKLKIVCGYKFKSLQL